MQAGAFTHPSAEVRAEAIQMTVDAGTWAKALGAREVVIWSAFDGYDYSLQVDYGAMWQRVVDGFRAVCDAHPDLKVSLEFKPTDENTRFFAVPSTGAALLLVRDIDRPNMGLTLDLGHCLAAGENPAQSAAMVGREGKLFGVQLNDGYQRLGAEDGLIFGSVHAAMALELCYWLQEVRFDGHVYFDTFPRNEDPVREAEYNIRAFKRFWAKAHRLRAEGVDGFLRAHDALGTLELLERLEGSA
jgi:sugar phosphate isomerase/epimerase